MIIKVENKFHCVLAACLAVYGVFRLTEPNPGFGFMYLALAVWNAYTGLSVKR